MKDNGGWITASQATAAGIPRSRLSEWVAAGQLHKSERGVYVLPEVWEDEMLSLQYRFAAGVYSHETALYLHSLTDRTPTRFTMTFPHGYNPTSAKRKGLIAKTAQEAFFSLGVIEMASPCGNPIRVYDAERTLCDILRGRGIDPGVTAAAFKQYLAHGKVDVGKIMGYAKALRVTAKAQNYLEVLQ
jgi:predicted transcriptional regulator of viral defense system